MIPLRKKKVIAELTEMQKNSKGALATYLEQCISYVKKDSVGVTEAEDELKEAKVVSNNYAKRRAKLDSDKSSKDSDEISKVRDEGFSFTTTKGVAHSLDELEEMLTNDVGEREAKIIVDDIRDKIKSGATSSAIIHEVNTDKDTMAGMFGFGEKDKDKKGKEGKSKKDEQKEPQFIVDICEAVRENKERKTKENNDLAEHLSRHLKDAADEFGVKDVEEFYSAVSDFQAVFLVFKDHIVNHFIRAGFSKRQANVFFMYLSIAMGHYNKEKVDAMMDTLEIDSVVDLLKELE